MGWFYWIILAVLFSFHFYVRYNKAGRIINKIPGPTAIPIIGNLYDLNVPLDEMWKKCRRICKQYYPVFKVWLPTRAVISIYHPDDLEILLSSQKNVKKGFIYGFMRAWLRNGLLTSFGDHWRQRRKILTRAFHFNILKKNIDVVLDQSNRLIERLDTEGLESTQNVIPFFSQITLCIIAEAAMGVSMDKLDKKVADDYMNAIGEFSEILCIRLSKPYISDWVLHFYRKMFNAHEKALKVLHGFSEKIICERKKYREQCKNIKYLKESNDGEDSDEDPSKNKFYNGFKKNLAMLDLLLSAADDKSIDDKGIHEEVDTIMFAGHDTSAVTMAYALLLLAENQEAQVRARAEVTEVLDSTEGKMSMSEIQQLHYIERCIKETLRLYPIASTIFRDITEDIQLKHCFVPAGSEVMVHFYETHRDPNFWPEPDKFDPERFLPERILKRHPFSYLPFSAGPRNCIGQKFALLELKCLLGKILYHYHLEPVTRSCDIKLRAGIIIRPEKPIYVKFIRIRK